MKLTKTGIDIRNVMSLDFSGMYFDEFVAYHKMVVERKNAEITALYDNITALNDSKSTEIIALYDQITALNNSKSTEITALYDQITALNDSKFQCVHNMLEFMKGERTKTVHRMLKSDFSIEQIAELLDYSVEKIRESVETEH